MGENLSDTNHNQKSRGWLLPPAKEGQLRAGLYLVATPIGNLGDMSLRALDVLSRVNVVLCEDSRVSGKLLKHFGIEAKLGRYNDHSDEKMREKIIAQIQGGEAVALISDAGMPLISDPGYKLVADIQKAGLEVTSVPGANAPLTALQLSGFPSDRFSFLGFLPSKTKARKDALAPWCDVPGTLIAFEAAPRLKDALVDIGAVMAGREVAVIRELTKLHEQVRRGSAQDLATYYHERGAPKGEIVLVIGPPSKREYSEDDLKALLAEALRTQSTKKAAAEVAAKTGASKSVLYDLALKVAKK